MQSNIIKVSRFSTDDGPGIRTTVFLKGCPLKCLWCHNPESQNKKVEISFDYAKCVSCGKCLGSCENNCHQFVDGVKKFYKDNCTTCGKCVSECPTQALSVYGKMASVDEIINEVIKDKIFYETSNGGVTISGGEPLYQHQFTIEILKRCRELNINTAIETSGFASLEVFKEVVKYCDYVLFDIKETNLENHLKYTGVPFDPILQNLKYLNETEVPYLIRCPIIPGLNDRIDHFEKLNNLIEYNKNFQGIEIMPYHSLGNYKYNNLQREYSLKDIEEPNSKLVETWRSYIKFHIK